MKTKDISPKQYAKWRGCHVSYIHRLLLENKIEEMEFVRKIKKYSRFYTLEVPHDLTEDSFIEIRAKKSIRS